jgi:nitroreductase
MRDHIVQEDIPAGAAFEAWRIPLLSPAQFKGLGSGHLETSHLRYLAAWGLLAPTSHNTVPQRFRLIPDQGRIDILVDRRAVLERSDPSGRQGLISVGCALLNLEIAAEAVGLEPLVRFEQVDPSLITPWKEGLSERSPHVHVASVSLRPGNPQRGAEWLALLRQHKVVRAEYDRQVKLPPSLRTRFEKLMTQPGLGDVANLHLIEGLASQRALGRFQEQADRFFFESTPFVRELGRWLLPNADTQAGLGMRGREFGFDDEFSNHVHLAFSGERTLLPDQVAGFAKGGRMGLESSSAIALITVEREQPAALVQAGRAAQWMALEALREGFYTAFHAALTEADWVREMVAATLLNTQRKLVVVLRIGKPKRPQDLGRARASRPPLDSILLS